MLRVPTTLCPRCRHPALAGADRCEYCGLRRADWQPRDSGAGRSRASRQLLAIGVLGVCVAAAHLTSSAASAAHRLRELRAEQRRLAEKSSTAGLKVRTAEQRIAARLREANLSMQEYERCERGTYPEIDKEVGARNDAVARVLGFVLRQMRVEELIAGH